MLKDRLDSPAGRWLVYTESTRYLVDFDHDTVDIFAAHIMGGPAAQRLALVAVQECAIGQPLTIRVRRHGDDHEYVRNGSPVTRLCKLFTQMDIDAQRARHSH
jgi:hypothetical protein